jgi:sterol desaturase/sphingolipid hydroxylase (fatty acid hydroxylase superfamily)
MSFKEKQDKNRAIIENVLFVFAFGFIMYTLVSRYWFNIYNSIDGKGYFGALIDPVSTHEYYKIFVTAVLMLNATGILWEILSLIMLLLKQERSNTHGYAKYKRIFNTVLVNYKPSFLALLILELLPKLILVHMFWIWLPHLQRIGLFTINLKWYSWIYAYVCWEFSTWIFHFSCHRVRFLWCLHAPHHAPTELNISVTWIHFFAESYYSTIVHLIILTPLGVNPLMFVAIMSISDAWGTFVHVSEGALKNGKLGILQYLLITPAHHRVHHAKNPLYIDTNFATVVPIWDWVFGTLQPIKDDVKTDYGLTRDLDVTNFSDLYFGEISLLYQDVKNAEKIKNKLLYLVKPPGWTPAGAAQTASVLRRDFLKTNPALGVTSKDKILNAVRSGFKMYKLPAARVKIADSFLSEIE